MAGLLMTLNDVQAGDEVVLRDTGYPIRRELVTVDRATKAQIIIGSQRFNRDGGYLRGSTGYNRTRIEAATEENRQAAVIGMKKREVEHVLHRLSRREKLSEAVMDKILEAWKLAGEVPDDSD